MNEPNLPPDELASAFLDGELAGPAADAVGRDPETAARADELRRAADAVAAPVTPPAGAADAAVEAALADFEARRAAVADPVRLRARRLPLIAGVAAAVAIGFIVAAALGLFAEREGAGDTAGVAAPAPPPPAAEAAPADEPAAAMAAEPEEAVEMAAPPPPAEPAPAPEPAPPPPAAPEPMAQPADDAAAQAAPADERVATEAAAAAPAQAESAATQAAPPPSADEAAAAPAEAAPAAGSEMMDGVGDVEVAAAERAPAAPDGCAAAVGDGTVELRITVGETPVLIVHTVDERLVALDGATCDEIPAEPVDSAYPLPSESCVAAVGDSRIALKVTVGETPVLIVHTVDARLVALGGATCDESPPTESG